MLGTILSAVITALFKALFQFLKEKDRQSVLTQNAVLKEIINLQQQEPAFRKLLQMEASKAVAKLEEAAAQGKEDELWNSGK
ncbi:MAG: hypothetical protein WBK76_00620 [Candidatus Saccharimonadales bacterium]